MIQVLAISVLASLCLAATFPASDTFFTLYEKFELAVRPCALGGELCEGGNLDPERGTIFQANYNRIPEEDEGAAPDLRNLSPVLDWRSELLARLRSGVQYTGAKTEFIPVTPQRSSFQVIDPLLDLSFDVNHQPDEKADECRPPDAEHAERVCNYSWAYALKALMDSAYNRSTGEDNRFSFDFIRHCLFDVEEQCEMKRPIEMLLDVAQGSVYVPFEEDFDYGGADTCSTYIRDMEYGGEFVVHTPEQPNRGGLMNLVVDFPTMVLVGVSLESLQIRGSGVRYSARSGLQSNCVANGSPNLYGVMSGYVEYNPITMGVGNGMWFVDTRPMSCFEAVLNLPMTSNETNGNFAGIAAYAVGLSFEKRRNGRVGPSHEFFSMFDPMTSSLKFTQGYCADHVITHERLGDFDYLNEVEFHGACRFSVWTGGQVVDAPPSWLRARKMRGGCVRDGSTMKCAGMSHVTRIEVDCNNNCDGVESFFFDSMPRVRQIVLSKHYNEGGPSVGKSIDFSANQRLFVTSLSILGSNWFPEIRTLDVRWLSNLRYLTVRGYGSYRDSQNLLLRNLSRLERVTLEGSRMMVGFDKIDLSGSFRKGYDTTLSFLNGAASSCDGDVNIDTENGINLFRMLVAGRDNEGRPSLARLKGYYINAAENESGLRGFYYNPGDTNATPESTFAYRHTALFKGDDSAGELEVVHFDRAWFQEMIIDSSLKHLLWLDTTNLKRLRRLEIAGNDIMRNLKRIDLAGSFNIEDGSSEIYIHDGTMRGSVSGGARADLYFTNVLAARFYMKNFKIHAVFTLFLGNIRGVKSMEFDNADIDCYVFGLNASGLREFIVRGHGSLLLCRALTLNDSFTDASVWEIEHGIQIPHASAANDKVFAGVQSVKYCLKPAGNQMAGDKIIASIRAMLPGLPIVTGEPGGCPV